MRQHLLSTPHILVEMRTRTKQLCLQQCWSRAEAAHMNTECFLLPISIQEDTRFLGITTLMPSFGDGIAGRC